MAVSESNNQTILEGTFEHALTAYLQKGESKEAMLKKFNGDKTELVKFLRDRDYNEWIKTNKKPADTSDINKKIGDLKKKHEEDMADGSLKLYDTPRVKEKVDAPVPVAPPASKSKSVPAKPEAPKVEVKKEEKPIVKYVEPPVLKKKWAKQKEKPKPDKDQQSFF
jgi:hypothetical protein